MPNFNRANPSNNAIHPRSAMSLRIAMAMDKKSVIINNQSSPMRRWCFRKHRRGRWKVHCCSWYRRQPFQTHQASHQRCWREIRIRLNRYLKIEWNSRGVDSTNHTVLAVAGLGAVEVDRLGVVDGDSEGLTANCWKSRPEASSSRLTRVGKVSLDGVMVCLEEVEDDPNTMVSAA